MLYLNMFFITLICILVIDDSGFINSIKYAIGRFLKIRNYQNIKLSPFDCSYCSSFWCNVIYLFVTNHLTIFNITLALLLSTFTIQIYECIRLTKDIITKIINKIYEIL